MTLSKRITLLLINLFFISCCFAQRRVTNTTDKVSLDIISAPSRSWGDSSETVKHVEFDWPFPPGPLSVGGRSDILKKVNTILTDNHVDCPPTRSKLSSNIWLCGNGKKIRTNTEKLTQLLTEAWSANE